jgi:hypothetical protein
MLIGALGALALSTAPASAATVPLAGRGENIQPIARVEIPRPGEVELAGDWAFVSTDATEQLGGTLTIVNIADPTKPFIEGVWDSKAAGIQDASYGDVDLSPDGNLAVLTNAHCETCAEGEVAWTVVLDTTDKAHPRLLGKFVDDATTDYVHTSTLDNKTLYMNPQVWAGLPQPGNSHITVLDISEPTKPTKIGTVTTPLADVGLAHDTYIDHRPDGKTLMYAASMTKTDVIDVSDPLKSTWLQSTFSPEITISHDVQPNHDRSVIVVDDEGVLGGQLDESISVCGKVGGPGPLALDSGSVHFYGAAPDGTFADGGLVELGSFNAPTNVNTGACVAHVFWQAPDQNRLTQAYYRTGAFIVDFEDLANPRSLGWFVADGGSIYWSNKPHRGYMFATDMDHGLDVLKYTGEGGAKWPATAGPAEIQRSARQGVPYVPIRGAGTAPLRPAKPAVDKRALGRFSFTKHVKRVPGSASKGKKRTLRLSFRDAKGKAVGSLRFKRARGRKTTVKVSGIAETGRYSWLLKADRKVLGRGRFTVKKTKGLKLAPGAKLAARVS